MSQHDLPELKTCHVDDLKIPDFDERKTVQVAALLVKRFNNKIDTYIFRRNRQAYLTCVIEVLIRKAQRFRLLGFL